MTDWLLLLKFGVRELGISPGEFWQMTLKEFLAIADVGDEGVSVKEIEGLMRKFPD